MCVVLLQPVQDAGRNEGDKPSQRMTLSEIRSRIIEADNLFGDADMIRTNALSSWKYLYWLWN